MAGIIALFAVLVAVLIYFIVIWVIRAHKRQVSAGREGMVGQKAVVKTALAPKGIVIAEGENWQAIIDKGRAEPEEEVIITKVEGLRLRVTRKE